MYQSEYGAYGVCIRRRQIGDEGTRVPEINSVMSIDLELVKVHQENHRGILPMLITASTGRTATNCRHDFHDHIGHCLDGGRVLAIEAGKTILIDETETITRANRYGMTVVALPDPPGTV